MYFHVLTLFPSMFQSPLDESILKRAVDKGLLQVDITDIRDFSGDKHRKVDDTPYGGGAGMVMTCQPIFSAFEAVKKGIEGKRVRTVFMTPQGKTFTQRTAERLSTYDDIVILCGHYEGVDQRVRDSLIDEEISIGNYVLTGGELPAMVLIDAISRNIPGVVGKNASVEEDSFSKALGGKKEYPHYTKPPEFQGMSVPDVLLSGHHKEIDDWRKERLK